jgi:hypothetical protein
VQVADFGIRGVRLVYQILEQGYQTVVLVDALPIGEPPVTPVGGTRIVDMLVGDPLPRIC